eukprot:gene6309-biopygen23858
MAQSRQTMARAVIAPPGRAKAVVAGGAESLRVPSSRVRARAAPVPWLTACWPRPYPSVACEGWGMGCGAPRPPYRCAGICGAEMLLRRTYDTAQGCPPPRPHTRAGFVAVQQAIGVGELVLGVALAVGRVHARLPVLPHGLMVVAKLHLELCLRVEIAVLCFPLQPRPASDRQAGPRGYEHRGHPCSGRGGGRCSCSTKHRHPLPSFANWLADGAHPAGRGDEALNLTESGGRQLLHEFRRCRGGQVRQAVKHRRVRGWG